MFGLRWTEPWAAVHKSLSRTCVVVLLCDVHWYTCSTKSVTCRPHIYHQHHQLPNVRGGRGVLLYAGGSDLSIHVLAWYDTTPNISTPPSPAMTATHQLEPAASHSSRRGSTPTTPGPLVCQTNQPDQPASSTAVHDLAIPLPDKVHTSRPRRSSSLDPGICPSRVQAFRQTTCRARTSLSPREIYQQGEYRSIYILYRSGVSTWNPLHCPKKKKLGLDRRHAFPIEMACMHACLTPSGLMCLSVPPTVVLSSLALSSIRNNTSTVRCDTS